MRLWRNKRCCHRDAARHVVVRVYGLPESHRHRPFRRCNLSRTPGYDKRLPHGIYAARRFRRHPDPLFLPAMRHPDCRQKLTLAGGLADACRAVFEGGLVHPQPGDLSSQPSGLGQLARCPQTPDLSLTTPRLQYNALVYLPLGPSICKTPDLTFARYSGNAHQNLASFGDIRLILFNPWFDTARR